MKMHGNDWTTLCPAPMNDDPVWPDSNPGNRYGWGCIIFDTYMNVSVVGGNALTMVTGGPTYDHNWRGDTTYGKFALGFDYDKTGGLATNMRGVAASCRNNDPDGGREVDGDRVNPNKDDRDWSY